MFSSYSILLVALSALAVAATPSTHQLHARAPVDNIVYVTSAKKHCLMMPSKPKTRIQDSINNVNMKTYCTPAGRYSGQQGQLPPDFWSNIEFKTGKGPTGQRYAQLTGCINPTRLTRLVSDDSGGQYDSDSGEDCEGTPRNAVCLGYENWIQRIEPEKSRACIKCCSDIDDCFNDKEGGCPEVIPGNYFNCAA